MVEGKSILRKYHRMVYKYVENALDHSWVDIRPDEEKYPDKVKSFQEIIHAWQEIDAFLTRELRKEDE